MADNFDEMFGQVPDTKKEEEESEVVEAPEEEAPEEEAPEEEAPEEEAPEEEAPEEEAPETDIEEEKEVVSGGAIRVGIPGRFALVDPDSGVMIRPLSAVPDGIVCPVTGWLEVQMEAGVVIKVEI